MRLLLPTMMALMVGCGGAPPIVQYSGIKKEHRVEERKLPESPDAKPIPKEKDWVTPLPSSQCTDEKGTVRKTKHGVLLSPDKAARAKAWQVAYKNLRDIFDLDRQIFGQHRIVYEERIGQANKEIVRLSPSWWDKNKTTVAWATGFVLGAAATIGIVYAVDEVKQ